MVETQDPLGESLNAFGESRVAFGRDARRPGGVASRPWGSRETPLVESRAALGGGGALRAHSGIKRKRR